MRLVPDSASAWRITWLMHHGALLVILGGVFGAGCLRMFWTETDPTWRARNLGGAVAWLVAGVAGLAIVVTGSMGHTARRARSRPLEPAAQRSGFRRRP